MVYMVARIFKQNQLIGFKLLESDSQEVQNMSYEKVLNALKAGIEIENLKLSENRNEIKGKGGSLSRYSAITISGELISKASIVILEKGNREGRSHKISNHLGAVTYLVNSDLSMFSNFELGIANGKICKDREGKYYISAIEGEYAEAKDGIEVRQVRKTKYRVPRVEKNTQIENGFTYVSGKEFKKLRAFKDIHIDTYVHKKGIRHGDTGAIYNDILINLVSRDTIGITEFRYTEYTHFMMYADRHNIMVDDILFIGGRYKSIVQGTVYTDNIEDIIIALGQVGLIIIKEGKIKCITYKDIDTLESLTKELIKNKITSEMLRTNDINYILYMAKNCIYQLLKDVSIREIEGSGVDTTKYEDASQGIHSIKSVYTANIASHSTSYIFTMADYLRDALISEVKLALGDSIGKVAYFSHASRPIRLGGGEGYLRDIMGHKVLNKRSIKLRYVGYKILYDMGIIEQPSSVWLDTEDYKIISREVMGKEIFGNTLIIYCANNKICYDIELLKSLYEREKKELEENKDKANKLNRKTRVLGSSIEVDAAGYIIDWDDGEKIIQTSLIKGIKVGSSENTSRGINKCIEIKVRGDIDIINRSYNGNYRISLVYDSSQYDRLIERITNIDYSIDYSLDLEGANCEDLHKIFGMLIRNKIYDVIILNNERREVSLQAEDITLRMLIINGSKIISNKTYDKSVKQKLKILNGTEVENSIKTDFIRECLSCIPKRVTNEGNISVRMVEFIIETLYKDSERKEVLQGFYRWLKNR